MDKPQRKLLILTNNQILVSQIEEVGADIGEPDCKLIEPFVLNNDGTLSPWLVEHTNQNNKHDFVGQDYDSCRSNTNTT